jgi:hypothetical protein
MDGTSDKRFTTVNIPINSIVATSGQNDSGIFDLQLKDERYIPFEGAGVISTWQLQLPAGFRQFDYDSILRIKHISSDGGDKLASPAADSVTQYIKSVTNLSQEQGLLALFDLKSEFRSEWIKLSMLSSSSMPAPAVLVLSNLLNRLPVFTRGRNPTQIRATGVTILTTMNLSRSDFALDPAYVPPAPGKSVDTSKDSMFDSGPTQVGKL